MSGEITITAGKQWDCINGEKIDCDKLQLTANPSAKINEGAVDTRELANGGVTSEKLSDDIISQINADAVIKNGSVTTQKLADGAVTLIKLSPSLVDIIWPIDGLILAENDSDTYTADKGIPGTWIRVAEGRALSGIDKSDTEYDATGDSDAAPTATWAGQKTFIIVAANLPSGNILDISSSGSHDHGLGNTGNLRTDTNTLGGTNDNAISGGGNVGLVPLSAFAAAGEHTHTGSITGATDTPIDNRAPGFIAAVWKRTA